MFLSKLIPSCLLVSLAFAHAALAEPIRSGNPVTIEIAERYLSAYTSLDLPALEGFYADNVVFTDPTSFHIPEVTQPVHFEGKDAVLDFITSLEGVVLNARYELGRLYESSGQVVFTGEAVFTFHAEPEPVAYRAGVVTVIAIADGQVTEHRDYADYAGLQPVGETLTP